MASITKTEYGTYRVQYRTPEGKQRVKNFKRKTDATNFSHKVEADKLQGTYVDPNPAKLITFKENGAEWLEALRARGRKPNTLKTYGEHLNGPVQTFFGSMRLASIDRRDLDSYVRTLRQRGLSHGYIRKSIDVVARSLNYAVETGRLKANPAARYPLTKTGVDREIVPLTATQVEALAEEVGTTQPSYATMVRLGAYCGLRAAEVAGLRVCDVDLARRRIRIAQVLIELSRGNRDDYKPLAYQGKIYPGLYIDSTKTAKVEEVPVPNSLLSALGALITGRKPTEFVFLSPEGGPLLYHNFYRRCYKPAVLRSGLPTNTRFHDLRHTFASLLIAQGISMKGLMERMRHATMAMVQRYAHLFPHLDEKYTDALDAEIVAAQMQHAEAA